MDVDDDDDLQKALQMSKQGAKDTATEEKKEGGLALDPNYMASVLLGLEGMDPNDPEVKVCALSNELCSVRALLTFCVENP